MYTADQAQKVVDALMAAQAESAGASTVTIDGKTVTYSSLKEIREAITFWASEVARLRRTAAGGSALGFSVANFSRRS